jgi:DUF4097 and DUF4098 domain-containing protein YvlB
MRTLIMILAASAAFAAEWSKSYNSASPDLEIRCDDGSLEFTRGVAGRVDVRVTTKNIEIKPGEIEIIESQSGDAIRVHVKLPRQFNLAWSAGRTVHVTVNVPPKLTLRAATGDGSIRASGIAGDLRLTSGDGSITASGVDGSLEARTGDGSMTLSGRFDTLRVSSGDGSMEIEAAPGSQVSSSWNIDTGDGSVRVRLPRDLRADLDARTGDGSMRVDFPGLTSDSSRDRDVRGRMNGGGLPLRVRSGDGSITISASR